MASAALTAIPSKKEFRLDFAFCSSAVSGSLCLCLPVPAGVAVPSTSLATTVQHAGTAGVLDRRGWVLENVTARVCIERREDVSE